MRQKYNNIFGKWYLRIGCIKMVSSNWLHQNHFEKYEMVASDVTTITHDYHCKEMKFSIKDIFSKCDQIRRKLRIWLHLLKKSLMENFIFLCSA